MGCSRQRFLSQVLWDEGPGELLSAGESSFVPNHGLKDREGGGSEHRRAP